MRFKIALLAIAITYQPIQARAQIAEAAGTGVVLDKIRSELDSTIDQAQQSGEFLIWQAGVQARDMLDQWKETNADLLNVAFSKLDRQTRDVFSKMDALTQKVNEDVSHRLEEAQSLADTALLLPTSMYFNGKVYVTRYSPRLLVPGGQMPRVFTINGANFAEANPVLMLKNGTSLDRISLTATEVKFVLPPNVYDTRDGGIGTVAMKLTYTRNPTAIFRKRVTKDLMLWALPPEFGTYSVVPTVETSDRVTKMLEIHTGKIKGRDKNIEAGISPPDGWRFDLDRIDSAATVRGEGGEAGRCQNFPKNNRSENGIRVQVRVDHINKWGQKKDGWIRCVATVPVYQINKGKKELEPIKGPMAWNNDIRIAPPERLLGWKVTTKTMDGRSSEYNGDATNNFFSLKADSAGIIIRPIPPKSL